MTPSIDATGMAALAAALQGEYDAPITQDRVIAGALDLVPDADHASLTLRRHGTYTSLGSSSPVATEADELQYRLDEGPCVDAVEHAELFRSGDIGHDSRWPRWGPGAARIGVGSVLSVRLVSQGAPIGAMNFYAEEVGRFSDAEQIDLAVIFATHAALALSSARLVTDLETAVTSRHLIGMAQGILMERYQIKPDEAFAVLRRLSSIHNRKLRVLAEDIVTTRDVPLGKP